MTLGITPIIGSGSLLHICAIPCYFVRLTYKFAFSLSLSLFLIKNSYSVSLPLPLFSLNFPVFLHDFLLFLHYLFLHCPCLPFPSPLVFPSFSSCQSAPQQLTSVWALVVRRACRQCCPVTSPLPSSAFCSASCWCMAAGRTYACASFCAISSTKTSPSPSFTSGTHSSVDSPHR